MKTKIFTSADYDKFFNDKGDGDTIKNYYFNYFKNAIQIAPEKNGDHPDDWHLTYNASYDECLEEWKTEPVNFHIYFEPATSFSEYINEFDLMEDIIYRMGIRIQKDHPDLFIVTTEDRLSIFIKQ